jgi:hypothetical protein
VYISKIINDRDKVERWTLQSFSEAEVLELYADILEELQERGITQ